MTKTDPVTLSLILMRDMPGDAAVRLSRDGKWTNGGWVPRSLIVEMAGDGPDKTEGLGFLSRVRVTLPRFKAIEAGLLVESTGGGLF